MPLAPRPYLQSVTLLREKVASFEEYPFSLPIVKSLENIAFHSDVTFFVGDNGSGKSTLIEAIAIMMRFNAEGGSKNFNFSTAATHSPLHTFLRPSKSYKMPRDGYFLRAESFYNVASTIDTLGVQDYYGGNSLHHQSHGESFWSLLTKRLGENGLYILDEPEAALSPTRQMAMLARMHELVSKESQFIIATHSPILLAYPNAIIYELRGERLHITPYEETEHYKITRRFLVDYRKQLDVLLERVAP